MVIRMKKVLFVASVYKFLNFEVNNMSLLKDMGYEIHTATNMNESDWLKDDGSLDYLDLIKHQIDFGRTPFSKQGIKAYRQICELLKNEEFNLIHCHTPVASVIARLAARKYRNKGLKVIYTCHGFHFHKTSSKKDWILYYPVEKLMANYTDMIITINKEDYHVIEKFKVKEKRYIPGVGVDTDNIINMVVDKKQIRNEIGIKEDKFMILSVGELSKRKNHEVIIRALAKLKDENIIFAICGTGVLEQYLKELAESLKISDKVVFLGQQQYKRVIELHKVADLGALPSIIEGLGLAGIESLAAGTPLVASRVHGIKDYVIDNKTGIGCSPNDVNAFANAIKLLKDNKELYNICCKNAINKAIEFDIKRVSAFMKENYSFFDK